MSLPSLATTTTITTTRTSNGNGSSRTQQRSNKKRPNSSAASASAPPDGFFTMEGARLTYQEVEGGHPPQNAVQEMYQPTMHQGLRNPPANVAVVLPPQDGSYRADQLPPIYLMRKKDAKQAYALNGKKPISLNHHAAGWGNLHFAVVYPRTGRPAGPTEDSSASYFQAPSREKEEFVAIKQLDKAVVESHLQEGGTENPYKEIARMEELGDNVHVLQCHEVLEDEQYLYIVTPKACSEGTLKDVIPWGTDDRMDPNRVLRIFRQLLDILLYLERRGICHRDMSPDNFLFLTPDRLVVFDFAKSLRVPRRRDNPHQRSLMAPQGAFGTFSYMPAEVFVNRAYDSVGSDLWSVTVILYNMLTSQFLYELPLPTDICFLYFILARGLSSEPINEMTVEILMDMLPPGGLRNGFRQPDQSNLLSRAIAHLSLEASAMEVLENVLLMSPNRRWTLAQVIESDFVNQPDE